MGFSENAARRAAHVTQNAGVEPAINWVMEHMDDADLNDPHPDFLPRSAASQASQGQRQVRRALYQRFIIALAKHRCGAGTHRTADRPRLHRTSGKVQP